VNLLRSITWRAVLLTQLLGAVFALTPWLEEWGQPGQPYLPFSLLEQSLTALIMMLAAFAGDEYVRRGWSVLRAFAVILVGAFGATALLHWGMTQLLGVSDPYQGFQQLLNSFLGAGAYWGMPLLVYLNRQSAARLLATVRAGELRRVQAERRLVESDLAAAQAQINPAAVLEKLSQVRDLYEAASAEADRELELLIGELRETATRSARIRTERAEGLT
jgi:hypothetical protein